MALEQTSARWSTGWVIGAVLLLAAGIALGFVLGRRPFSGQPTTVPNAPDVQLPAANAGPGTAEQGSPGHVSRVVAEDAREAVAVFLEAESEGDFARSFDVLVRSDRRRLGPAAAWRNLHAEVPRITGFEILQVRATDGEAVEVVTDLQLESMLDPFVGLVPARALGRWNVVEQGSDWRVAYSRSVLDPRYPPEEQAAAAAESWLAALQSCDSPSPRFPGPLFGDPRLVEDLCGVEGKPTAGRVGMLPSTPDTTTLVDAFGSEVYDWARVVPVGGAVSVRAVLAPIDDAWVVIGVLEGP